jgi:predicted nucleic acid-binding protein
MSAMIDTSVVIDVLRGYEPVLTWLESQRSLTVTRIVLLEVLEGAGTAQKQNEALRLLERFEIIELTPSDFVWATDQLLRFRLAQGVDVFDCLIAAPAYRLQTTLFTRNLKHFTPLLGKLAQTPYR